MDRSIISSSTSSRPRGRGSFYFGKIASRGDFVKSVAGSDVIALFDRWFAQGMEALLAYPDWKSYYDNAGPIDFLFTSTRNKLAICGCLMPSSDASSRRFPFTAATVFETTEPLAFLPLSPLFLERHAGHHRALAHHAAKTHDATDALATLGAISFERELAAESVVDDYKKYLTQTSVDTLAEALSLEEGPPAIRRMVLALAFLLQPLLAGQAVEPHKGIALPLPRNPAQLALVKALWLDMVSVFLPQTVLDLSVFSCVHGGMPKLIITFNGTTPSTFRALFDEHAAQEHFIEVAFSDWIEEVVGQQPSAAKLSGYLRHGELTLRQMTETFREGYSE